MTDSIELLTIVNDPISSNCHVFICPKSHHCFLVDPGSENGGYIDDIICREKLVPDFIVLTHEHFDHIWSCQYFVDKYNIPIICSKACAEAITRPKTNLSLFFDNQKAFSCPPATGIVEEMGYCLMWNSYLIRFFLATGHSCGGIMFLIEQYLVTGDTLIQGQRTVTKLHTGSKERQKESLSLLELFKGFGYTVCTGHGENFGLDKYDLNKAI